MAAESIRQEHANLVSRSDFRTALDIAMLEYSEQLAGALTETPEAQAYKLRGAHEFVRVLLGLSRMPSKAPRTDHDNLPKDD